MTNATATTRPAGIDDVLRVVLPASPTTNAAGVTAFVRQSVDGDANVSELWLVGDDAPRQLTSGPADTAPVWDEVSGEVFFLRSVDGASHLFAISPAGGDARQLTFPADFPSGVESVALAPDGTRVAVTASVDLRAPSDDVYVATSLRHKVDGRGLRGSARVHLFQVTLASGGVQRLTDGDWDASEATYSPDGMTLAFAASAGADPLTLRSRVYALDLSVPTFPMRQIGQAVGVEAPLLWTPSGTEIIAVGAPTGGIHHAQLMVLSLDGSTDRSLTALLDRNVMKGGTGYPGGRPALTPAGDEVVFCLREGGSTHVWIAPLDGSPARSLLAGPQRVVSGLAVGPSSVRVVLATATSYGELVEIDAGGGVTELTTFGDALADVTIPVAIPRRFLISDGTEVEAFVYRDPELTAAGPLVLDVHGGPHNSWTGVPSIMQPHHLELVARGYTVLMVNPRGSDGYGEAFFTGVYDGWGEKDRADLLEPVHQLVAEGIAHPEQLLITGYSYGGFMTTALTASTDLFAAAVAGGLVCDLAHLAGASDEGIMLERFEFSASSGQSRRLSPLENVQNVTAPTLILHGEADVRCPVLQAEQWHAGLLAAGVDTELVLYPGGAHAFVLTGRPSHRVDYSRRLVQWFERHLSVKPARATYDRAFWQRRLDTLVAKYAIPGAQLGILTTERSGVRIDTVASGVLNTLTSAPVLTDSLFQIGSITKVWTGVLVMQLVEEGLLDLDAPVRSVLPAFRVADPHVSETVTVRALLTHASGIDGDVFIDTGRGDDAVERYVAALDDVVQNFAPGEDWSYCNTGFGVLGRIIEVLRGETWDEVLRTRILQPLGLRHTATLPEDTMRLSNAVGHTGNEPVPDVLIARSAGPAGLICARAEDVLRFAADAIADAPVLLSRAGHDAMLADQHVAGVDAIADMQGLAWFGHRWDDVVVHGHNGGTLGQQAFLRVARDAGVGVVLLANGGLMDAAAQELFTDVFSSFAGIDVPPSFAPVADAAPVTDAEAEYLIGHYGDAQAQIDVTWRGGVLSAHRVEDIDPSGRGRIRAEATFTIVRGPDGFFAAGVAGSPSWLRVWRRDHANTSVLHMGSRAFRRSDTQESA